MYDPVEASYNAQDAERYRWEMSRPICDICGEPIQEAVYYRILDKNICEGCLRDCRQWVEE